MYWTEETAWLQIDSKILIIMKMRQLLFEKTTREEIEKCQTNGYSFFQFLLTFMNHWFFLQESKHIDFNIYVADLLGF